MKTMKTRLTALFTAAALALSFAGCGAAASASASVAVDNGQQADYTVGILQYTSHSSLGEIAAAIIQVKEGETCTEEEINRFCNELPRYKRPRKIIFAPVPRNATGKIEKPRLREQYCSTRLVEAQSTS